MKNSLTAPLRQRAMAGALAGIIGGAAHAAVNEVDRRVLNHNADDLLMLGGVFTEDVGRARRIGIGMHLTFAAIFGATYAVLLQPKDDDDALRKGLGFATAEHVGLFPLSIPVDMHHPHAKNGNADRFWHPVSFLEATARHIALGFGIGKVYPFMVRALKKR